MKHTMRLVPDGETTTQYIVNWTIGEDNKGEVFDTRAGLYKQARQLKAVGIPFEVFRTRLSKMGIEGE